MLIRHRWAHIVWRWLPFIAWMGLIYWLSDQPELPHPARRLGLSDYLFECTAHAGTFGLLVLLGWRVCAVWESPLEKTPSTSIGVRWTVWAAGLWALLYAISDELHQRLVPGRWSSFQDWLADLAGILAAALLLAGWLRWRDAIWRSSIRRGWHSVVGTRSRRATFRRQRAQATEVPGDVSDATPPLGD